MSSHWVAQGTNGSSTSLSGIRLPYGAGGVDDRNFAGRTGSTDPERTTGPVSYLPKIGLSRRDPSDLRLRCQTDSERTVEKRGLRRGLFATSGTGFNSGTVANARR